MFLKNSFFGALFCFLGLLLLSCDGSNKKFSEIDEGKNLVVILGSSSAFGIGPVNRNNSWAVLLGDEETIRIKNLSYPGYTTYDFLPSGKPNFRNLTPDKDKNIDAAIKLAPKIIIFSITTNDIGRGYSIEEYLSNMKILTDLCIDNNIEYIVTSTHPRNPMSLEKRMALYNLSRKLEEVYEDRYVEIYNPLGDLNTYKWKSDLCVSDSVHGNEKAHLIIYNQVLLGYHKAVARLSHEEE
ncbi:SGNH/GDSL hydrolase family protein [Flavobacterium johnsoniae]|uniref:SGNH/GDSL hydrolase family protein n=1 Tax=Flavobacterium johnsoniae TaxID=986 RepID=UPI0011EE829D|nr:SGNH/GDSL hydrolase family protein [Flavobacterium johnsoniae]